MYQLKCIECDKTYPASELIHTCVECGGLLEVVYDLDAICVDFVESNQPQSVWKYRALLPFPADFKPVTIQEGGTPLYKLDTLAKTIGATNLYVKHEGLNPTGSFKDRGMTVGVSKAVELGMTTVACASTGNTSASLAIYGAKAQIPAVVLLPEGKVALGKVAQALMHGAKVLSVRGNFDDALTLVRQLCDSEGFYLLNSINPFRLEGIGVEPASATSVAGLIKLMENGIIKRDEVVVCITTGHLLKDSEEVIKMCESPIVVDATVEAVTKAVFG